MTTTIRRILLGLCVALLTITQVATAQMPKTATTSIPGQATVKTETLSGTVVAIEGNHIAVHMSTGEMRTFDVKPEARATVDGKEIGIEDLKVGTKLTATYTTTTTPITDRTVTVGTGTVWHVLGTTVILTLPNGEHRMYKVKDDYKFTIEGNKKATVFDLRKGMVVSAEKIVEEPRTEIAFNTKVTGTAPPPPRTDAAPTPAPTPPSAPEPELSPAKTITPSRAEPAPTTPSAKTTAPPVEPAQTAPPAKTTAPPVEPAQTAPPAEPSNTGRLVLGLVALFALLLIAVFAYRKRRHS
jgi:hypothetical protein